MRGCFDLRAEWVQNMKNWNKVKTELVESKENRADLFTKCFRSGEFKRLVRLVQG